MCRQLWRRTLCVWRGCRSWMLSRSSWLPFKSYIFFLCMAYMWTFIANAFIINRWHSPSKPRGGILRHQDVYLTEQCSITEWWSHAGSFDCGYHSGTVWRTIDLHLAPHPSLTLTLSSLLLWHRSFHPRFHLPRCGIGSWAMWCLCRRNSLISISILWLYSISSHANATAWTFRPVHYNRSPKGCWYF